MSDQHIPSKERLQDIRDAATQTLAVTEKRRYKNDAYADRIWLLQEVDRLQPFEEQTRHLERRIRELTEQLNCLKLDSRAVETSAGGWTVEEYRNGVWQRCAMGQAWQTNADAHQQCRELQERYPNRVFGVTTLKAGECLCATDEGAVRPDGSVYHRATCAKAGTVNGRAGE
jgi:hypothetical protein